MKKKFGWCFIGAGKIAQKCAAQISKGDSCYIASIWNRTTSKAEEFAKKYKAKMYTNVIDAINDPNVEGVYIALTNDKHYEYMKLCILNHKPVLCEKPFTMNEKEAKEIFELAKEHHVYVAEAMWTWFNEPALKVREWVRTNKINNIKEVNCCFAFTGVTPMYTVERLVNMDLLGGCLLDIGVYGVRYSLELFGYPKSIECKGNLYKTGSDLNETVIFHYDGFDIKHYFSVTELLMETYTIKGDNGNITAPFFHMTKSVSLKTDKEKENFKIKGFLYEKQFAIAASEIREGLLESRYVTKENTIKCMRLMDEIRKQLGVKYPNE